MDAKDQRERVAEIVQQLVDDGRHIHPLEAYEALDPAVGDGTPDSAPHELPDGALGRSQWWPTRKWMAALCGGLFLVAGHAFASAGWDATEWGELMVLGGSLSTAYWIRNNPEDD